MIYQHARIVVLCLLLAGCASDGNFASSMRERLVGDKVKSEADEAAQEPQVAEAPKPPAAEISTVALDLNNQPTGEIAESIVARVNGDAILAQDLFTPIRSQLAKAQQEMTAAQFAQFRTMAVQKKLRDLIELQLLIQEAKRHVPEAGIKRLEAAADGEFGKRIESEMKRMEVNTEAELRRKMLENGESLDQMREYHRRTFIAQQFLRMQLMPRLDVSREEMIEYYEQNIEQYRKEEAVRWSEILVSVDKYGSSEAARAKADQLVATLRRGHDFNELAKTESDGATAIDGGAWGWTTRGSYIVAAVDQVLFSSPPQQVSDPIEGPKGWHIVRVEEKQGGGATSFVDVQDEIRKAIREQKITSESQRYVQELARKALITTIFDRPNQPKTN